jgi:hypothetical protein
MPSILRLRNSYRQPLEPHYSDRDLMAFDKHIVDAARTRLPGALTPKLLMTSWTAPAEMKQNGSQKGGDPSNVLKKGADGKFIYKEFAEDYWLSSLHAYANLGIKPRWIRCVPSQIKQKLCLAPREESIEPNAISSSMMRCSPSRYRN